MAASALLLALSPAMVFYSRMFIQESLFACFTLWFVIGVGRVVTGGGLTWSVIAGIAAGLAIATKETSIIVLPAALAAAAIARWSLGSERPDRDAGLRRHGLPLATPMLGVALAGVVAALFYSSFLTNPPGVLQPLLGASTYLDRGTQPASHGHPWHYYLALLTYSASGGLRWSEALIVALAAVGALTAWTKGVGFWARYLACDVVIATTIFSALPYKTPWNVLPFYVVAIVLAGVGLSWLVHVSSSRAWRSGVALAFARGVSTTGMAGLARVGDLRRRSAKSVRLRADRARRRPHGGANPRACGPARGQGEHAGVGDRASLRTVAAAVVPADDADRRLLDQDRMIRWRSRRRSSSRRWSSPPRSTPRSATATCRSSTASGPRWC